MAYSDIAALQSDQDFRYRLMACAVTEGVHPPEQWVADNVWRMAAMPGFGEAYASALAGGVERPGKDPSVISDQMILSAFQSIPSPP